MAKSSLSISASRVLLGLGVVGITATSALAVEVKGDITQDGAPAGTTISGADGTPTIKFGGASTNNTLGTLGKYTSGGGGGTAQTITKLVVTDGGNLTLQGILGKDLENTAYNFEVAATKIIFGQNAKLYSNAADKLEGEVEFTGGNDITIGASASALDGTKISSLTVKGKGNTINLETGKSLTLGGTTSGGSIILNKGDLTIKGVANTQKVTIAGDAGKLEMQGDSNLVIDKATLQSNKDVIITGANNTIDLSSGGILDISGASTGLKIDGTAKDTANLTIKGANSGGELKFATDGTGLLVGHTNGLATLTLEKIGQKSGSELEVNQIVLGNAGDNKSPSEIILDHSFIKATSGALVSNVAGDRVTLQNGSIFTTNKGVTFNKGGTIDLSKGSKFAVTAEDTLFKAGNSFIILDNDAATKFTAGANGIKIGATTSGASLTIRGADKTNFAAGDGGFNLLVQDSKSDSLILEDSTIESKLTLSSGSAAVATHTINLDKTSKFTETTSTGLKIEKHTALNINMEKGAEFNAAKGITIGDSGSVLTVKGGTFNVVSGGNAIFKIGSAAESGGTVNLEGVTSTIDKLVVGATDSKAANTLNIKDSTVTINGTADYNLSGGATVNNSIVVDNSTVTTIGVTKLTGNNSGGDKGRHHFTIQNGSTIDLQGGISSSATGVPVFTFRGDNNIVKIGGESKTELMHSQYSLFTNNLLTTDSYTLMEATGNAGGFNSLNQAILNKVGFISDAQDLLSNKALLADNKYTYDFVVAEKNDINSHIADKQSSATSEYGKLMIKSYELALKNGDKELYIKTNTNNVTGKDATANKLWASAKDRAKTAEETLNAINIRLGQLASATTDAEKTEKANLTKAKLELEAIKAEGADLGLSFDAEKHSLENMAQKNVAESNKAAAGVAGNAMKGMDENNPIFDAFYQGENGSINYNGFNDAMTSMTNSGDLKVAGEIFGSAIRVNATGKEAQAIAKLLENPVFHSNTIESGQSASSMSDASSSTSAAINVANDMSIGNRVALNNNPYNNFNNAKRFAALDSDAAFDYYDTYKRSVWANVFGGTSIIDGDNGGLIGISAGIDSYLSDDFLLGTYLTYANATVKDNTLEQKGNNFQLGVYSLYKFAPTWELNLRASAQIGVIDQDKRVAGETRTSDFNRTTANLGFNVGKVFNAGNAFYIKPFVGANYYFAYTPSYTESKGTLNESVREQTNNSLSLEAGAEFRMYVSETSYIYATPKLEQFVVNSGDDYTANYVGSTESFTILTDDKKKTYGQLVLGGNMDISEALSLNAAVGVKQILAGKVNDKNETFVTGNVGVKYRF